MVFLDYIAISGYGFLSGFAGYKLVTEFYRLPLDFFMSLLLLTGLGTLIAYHLRHIVTRRDEYDDVHQQRLRIVAHASLLVFLLLQALPKSSSTFNYYEAIAVAAHMQLLVAVLTGWTQVPGVALLAVYFAFMSIRKLPSLREMDADVLQWAGCSLMLVFFTVATANSLMTAIASRTEDEAKSV